MISKRVLKGNQTTELNVIAEEKKFKANELRQIVLGGIGLGILLTGTFLVSPTFPIAFGAILDLIKDFTSEDIKIKKIKRVLKNLEKKAIISLEKKDGEINVRLKNGWTVETLKYSLKPLLEFKKKKKAWDGRWFLVFFDVPEIQRNKRDHLRRFLKQIGFYQYQQSVYLFPYNCKKEVELIKKIVEGAKYMSYVVADEIEDEDKAKIHFRL